MVPDRSVSRSLTAAQLRFGREYGASPGKLLSRDDGSILFYREYERTTERWLVDRHGRVREYVRLRR